MKYAPILLSLLLAPGACADHALAQDQRLIVFAAASLKDALDDVNAAYTRTKGVRVAASYAGSSQLIKQIEQGAPAEVFISADLESMDYGVRKNAVQERTRVGLLGNKLVLIAAADAAAGDVAIGPGFDLAALAGKGRIVTGDVRAVPAGRYAQAALEKLGLWSSVHGKLAMVENVRVALSLVARGEAPLGIVYETDAKAEPRVKVIGVFPADSHPPIVYPAALTAGAKSGGAAYLEFLQSSLARGIFEQRGFTVLSKTLQ
ncbi:MAG TPA: molybdate ABC transporter substrate-binding protein [Xanthobacteraceae bacterium]|nr:molybdate ABC transporter substrate-binding protein [Xanthobacteraceae bacterium]